MRIRDLETELSKKSEQNRMLTKDLEVSIHDFTEAQRELKRTQQALVNRGCRLMT